jgi:hypothetical protein
MSLAARLALTFAAWLAITVTTATVMFIVAWILAGPHAGLLPQPLEVAVWIAGYAVILLLPLVAAILIYRRLSAPRVCPSPQQLRSE